MSLTGMARRAGLVLEDDAGGGGGGGGGGTPDPVNGWDPPQEEFINNNEPLSMGLSRATSGGSINQTATTPQHPGVFDLSSGSGTAVVGTGGAFVLGGGTWSFKAGVMIPVLSNATDRFNARCAGVDSGISGGITADEINFKYQDDQNGGRWQAITRNGGTETSADTGVAVVAGAYYDVESQVNAGATSVSYLINGTHVATITTNIPSSATVGLLAAQSIVVAGAGGSVQIDYYKPTFVETAPR